MKYRMLTFEELTVLEEDLKAFLIVNGIDGSEWEKLNTQNPDKAQKLVELFSDLVLDKAYSKIDYLEFRSPETCIVFHFNEVETEFITLQLKDNAQGDLSSPESIHATLLNHTSGLQYVKNVRKNTRPKTEEIHQMLQQGCVPSIEEFWLSLNKVIDQNQ